MFSIFKRLGTKETRPCFLKLILTTFLILTTTVVFLDHVHFWLILCMIELQIEFWIQLYLQTVIFGSIPETIQ